MPASTSPAGAPWRASATPGARARLAICLPTYNRCELLAESLPALIARVRPHRIPIHVSDNCSDDATGAVVAGLQAGYDLLHYSRSDVVLPVDDHFVRVLGLPDADYRWLFGDHYRIVGDEALGRLLAALDDGPDVVVVNAEDRVRGIATQTYTQQDRVLDELGWHMTMMSALVYRAGALACMNLARFRGTQLIQTLSILEYLDGRSFRLHWIEDAVVGGIGATPANSWHARALQIFVRGWFVGVMSLPPGYAYEAKLRALRAHAEHVSLFTWRGLLHLRAIGAFEVATVRSHARELPYVLDVRRRALLWAAALVPLGALRAVKRGAARWRAKRAAHA